MNVPYFSPFKPKPAAELQLHWKGQRAVEHLTSHKDHKDGLPSLVALKFDEMVREDFSCLAISQDLLAVAKIEHKGPVTRVQWKTIDQHPSWLDALRRQVQRARQMIPVLGERSIARIVYQEHGVSFPNALKMQSSIVSRASLSQSGAGPSSSGSVAKGLAQDDQKAASAYEGHSYRQMGPRAAPAIPVKRRSSSPPSSDVHKKPRLESRGVPQVQSRNTGDTTSHPRTSVAQTTSSHSQPSQEAETAGRCTTCALREAQLVELKRQLMKMRVEQALGNREQLQALRDEMQKQLDAESAAHAESKQELNTQLAAMRRIHDAVAIQLKIKEAENTKLRAVVRAQVLEKMQAQKELADLKMEIEAPFVVPSIKRAFEKISLLAHNSVEAG
ncbi:hypothetical protein EIP91_011493 [Steccherinum ochraceum]|uniref:Uncharacterized protein n=1 Tax=Steccherinum ochraceum TaxID=92696 RepID=A0A4R0RW16_9APHY|nr:hypothetical protein EIP91_011493 [Steccherinum ochraceum]